MKRGIPILLIVGGLLVAGVWLYTRSLQPVPLPESPVARRPAQVAPGAAQGELDYIRAAEAIPDPLKRCKEFPAPSGFDWPRETTDALCDDFLSPRLQRSTMNGWIHDGEAEQLDAYFDGLLDGYLQGTVPEGFFWFSYTRKFELDGTHFRSLWDQWAAQRPGSAHAQLALAYHHLANAWGFRGHDYYADMPAADQLRMHDEVSLAVDAALRAIKLDKRLLPAYSIPIRLDPLGADNALARRLADEGLALRPDSYYLRVAMMFPATPIWGGSFGQMDAIAESGMQHVTTNPRMHALKGEAQAARGTALHLDDKHELAAPLFDAGLAFGPSYTDLLYGGFSQHASGNRARAVEYMSQALRFTPSDDDIIVSRAIQLTHLGQKEWAFADMERLLATGDNSNGRALRRYVWMLIRDSRYADAEARLRLLLQAEPKDRWVNRELASLYVYRMRQMEKARPHIDTLIAANPDDGAALLLQLDYLQNTNGEGIGEAAERFVKHADESDAEQKAALPKVKAWLASQK